MDMESQALAYAALGLPVFPCSPNDKQPLVVKRDSHGNIVKGEGGLKLATCDAAQISQWWHKWPEAMIAMRTGSRKSGGAGVFVVDLDPKDTSAKELLKLLVEQLGKMQAEAGAGAPSVTEFAKAFEASLSYALPAGPVVDTPRGGMHLWFLAPDDGPEIRNRANILKGRAEGIDVRGDDGYVILPPSKRAGRKAVEENCDGRRYEWRSGQPSGTGFVLPSAPAELARLATERTTEEAARTPRRTVTRAEALAGPANVEARQAALRKHVQAALDNELARVSNARKGERNNSLNIAALSLGKLIPGGYLVESAVRDLLYQAADVCGLVKEDGEHAALETIDSGVSAGKRNPRDLAEVGNFAGRSFSRPPPVTAADLIPSLPAADSFFYDDETPQPLLEREEGPADSHGGGFSGGPPGEEPPPSDDGPVGRDSEPLDMLKLAECALLQHNDSDNARRLRIWFGEEFINVDVADTPGGSIGVHFWTGTHWKVEGAYNEVMVLAQEVWPRIQAEADLIPPTEAEEIAFSEGSRATARIEAIDKELAAAGDDKAKRDALDSERKGMRLTEAKGMDARASLGARRGARRKFGTSSGNRARMDAMIKESIPHVSRQQREMDADPLAINCKNGTLRLARDAGGAWRVLLDEHDRRDMITKMMEVEFDPDAKAPHFMEFIEKLQPKAERRGFLQMYHGLALTGLTEQAFVLNYGLGANGKTTFIEALAGLQGNYAQTLPSEALTGEGQRRGDQATPELARLAGARLVRCAELPRGQGFRESVLKLLTGGDAIPVRQLHGKFWDLIPVFKAVGFCNEKPDISGVDEGIWRRVKLVLWEVSIDPHERRPLKDMLDEFEAERPGILNWLLDGLLRYMAEGFRVPADVQDATEAYRDDMDPVGAFVRGCVHKVRGSRVTAHAMYMAYQAYCHANALRVMSQKNFGAILNTKQGIEKIKGNIIQYLDVELHDVPADPTPGDGAKYSGRYGTHYPAMADARNREPADPIDNPQPLDRGDKE